MAALPPGRQLRDARFASFDHQEPLEDVVDRLEQLGAAHVDSGTYASLLCRCGNARALSQGRRVHGQIMRGVYECDTFVGNHVVQMYGKCGSLEDARIAFEKIQNRNVFSWNIMLAAYAQNGHLLEARIVFDKMPTRNVVSWNAMFVAYAQNGQLQEARSIFDKMTEQNVVSWNGMIAAYAQNGHANAALELFRVMDMEGVQATKVTWISVIDACASLMALTEGKLVHEDVKACELQSDVTVATALLDMYGKCGRLDESGRIFHEMPERNVVSWNAMIAAYGQNDCCKEALHLFHCMNLEGVQPDKVTLVSVFDVCSKSAALSEGKSIYATISDSGFHSDVTLETVVVNMFGNCSRLEEARSVFDKMPTKNAVSWTAMIRACTQNGVKSEALQLFRLMNLDGIQPDKVVFMSVLEAHGWVVLAELRVMHGYIMESGFQADAKVGTLLIILYSKSGSLQDAKASFDDILQGNVMSWTAMIMAYAQSGHSNKALQLFRMMDLEGVRPDAVTFAAILDACGNMGALAQCKLIHSAITETGFHIDTTLGIALVDMYGKCGGLQDASCVFSTMVEQNTMSPSERMVAGLYVQRMHEKEAVELFQAMELEGLKLDKITLINMINACSNASVGKLIHARIPGSEFESDVTVGAALINMHGKCGSVELGRKILDELSRQDVVLWTSMIAAYAQNGLSVEAMDVFNLMNLEGVQPNVITLIIVLSACSHTGMLDTARNYFVSVFQDYGIVPIAYHYACMVDLLGRAGRLEDAEELVSSMEVEQPGVIPWMTLLGACTIHGDAERAARSTQQVLQMDSKNAASYVLAANIYATLVAEDIPTRGICRKQERLADG